MPSLILHLIPNAHLDPVWLWDWREGMNEGIVTTRTILDLMDADPDVTFIRGEAAQYAHLERHDPETFDRVRRRVAEGRWDVVGGTWIQADTNLPATETFARHLLVGQRWLRSRFGLAPRVAWTADSFGHSAGLPEVYAAAGITGFAFTRPHNGIVPIEKPAFWWEGPSGARVLAYRPAVGWYGSERDEMPRRLDAVLAHAAAGDLEHVGVFFGVGNHGGGPTRRHIADIRAWAAAHPEIEIRWSGLHRFFAALDAEVARKGDAFLPTHRGELNFTLRGCYASVAKFKYLYRACENHLVRAERTDTAIATAFGTPTGDLSQAWEGVLFNSFHDILPGTAIERAFDDQLAWLGGVLHETQRAEITALNRLALRVDTSVETVADHPSAVAALVWNAHPRPYRGPLEIEASLDYRPIWAYQGRGHELPVRVLGPDREPVPFQLIKTEHDAMVDLPWRFRVIVHADLPPLGWAVYEIGWVEGHRAPAAPGVPAAADGDTAIDNGVCRVEAAVGGRGVRISRHGRPLLGGDGLGVVTVEDVFGSWGDMTDVAEARGLDRVLHEWTVTAIAMRERGPERSALWVRLAGGRSRLDLTFRLGRSRDVIDADARLFIDERSARVKLVLPIGDDVEFEVPGGSVRRGPSGEVPGGRWLRARSARGVVGFASDALYGFDAKDGVLRATVARASYYANDLRNDPAADPWRPAVDLGELRFRFLLSADEVGLPRLARELEEPPIALLVAPRRGEAGRRGSFCALAPDGVRMLALKPAEDGDGLIVRVHDEAGAGGEVRLTWLGDELCLGPLTPRSIATFRLRRAPHGWVATRTTIGEAPPAGASAK